MQRSLWKLRSGLARRQGTGRKGLAISYRALVAVVEIVKTLEIVEDMMTKDQ
jgi:hypothetical protein